MTAPGTTEGRGPVNDMWRVYIGGMSVMVRGEVAKDHLEAMRQEMARMKLALHKLKWFPGDVGKVAKKGLANDG